MDKEKLKNALEAILSDDSGAGDQDSNLDSDSTHDLQADDSQGSDVEDQRLKELEKQSNNNARNLRLKLQAEKKEKERLAAELKKYQEAEEQAKLSELSEVERYKSLLQKEKDEKTSLMSAKERAEFEAYQKEVDNLIYKAGVHDEEDVEIIRPALMKKLEDDTFNPKEFFDKLKKKSPGMFSATEQKKAGSVGSPPASGGREFSQTPGNKKWGGRSESLDERKEFDKAAQKYGITLRKRY